MLMGEEGVVGFPKFALFMRIDSAHGGRKGFRMYFEERIMFEDDACVVWIRVRNLCQRIGGTATVRALKIAKNGDVCRSVFRSLGRAVIISEFGRCREVSYFGIGNRGNLIFVITGHDEERNRFADEPGFMADVACLDEIAERGV